MNLKESDLHDYQKACVKHIIENPKGALFLEMGLGKTVSALTAIKKLMYEELEVERVLVIAPKRVVESVWGAEIEKWEHLQNLTIVQIVGSAKQRLSALQEPADIHIISRDNVAWLCDQYGGSTLPYDMLVIDELSSFKSQKSQRFKALRKVQPSFDRVVGLTGTPAPNGLEDLWSQIYLLDRGERLGKFITHYRNAHFVQNYNGWGYKLRSKEDEKLIHDKISDICISMKSEDYLTLPGTMENIIKIQFDEKMQKLYDDFEEEQVMQLIEDSEEGEITAANAAALSNKLLQFANGAVYDEDKNVHHIHDLKIDALKEIIEDSGGNPVLVTYAYKHDLDRIMRALKKYKPVKLETDQDVKNWNAGKTQVLVMHPASGGHGLNLQAGGNIIVWFGQTWSLELYQQLNARLDRQGQKNLVIIHKLVASKTIDQRVVRAIAGKADVQDGLMSAVKALVRKYDYLTK